MSSFILKFCQKTTFTTSTREFPDCPVVRTWSESSTAGSLGLTAGWRTEIPQST